MKVLMINSLCGIRSTGRICTDLAVDLAAAGHEVKIAYGRGNVPEPYRRFCIRIGSDVDVNLHGVKSRLTDGSGWGSVTVTKRFIKWIKEYDPDIIHLHNLHGYYLNVELLFRYLKTCGKQILWSFYDCWSFTGHCAHFDFNQCDKWKSGCDRCAHTNKYPKSFVNRAAQNYQRKKKLFTEIPDLQLIVPSRWMARMVSQSYMQNYPVHILPNGIDLSAFKTTKSDLRNQLGIGDRHLVLGVASTWTEMKGLSYFNRLAKELPQDRYQVVLVGRANAKELSNQILHIPETADIGELCRLYTAADVFVNPTLQETQGLTTVEAFACGTPAVVFNSGGAAECVDDTCGIVVERGDYQGMLSAACRVCEEKPFSEQSCMAKANEYSKSSCYSAFMKLYAELN